MPQTDADFIFTTRVDPVSAPPPESKLGKASQVVEPPGTAPGSTASIPHQRVAS